MACSKNLNNKPQYRGYFSSFSLACAQISQLPSKLRYSLRDHVWLAAAIAKLGEGKIAMLIIRTT